VDTLCRKLIKFIDKCNPDSKAPYLIRSCLLKLKTPIDKKTKPFNIKKLA
jgi:hypothetical protein